MKTVSRFKYRGYGCMIKEQDCGHLCGYVIIPEWHAGVNKDMYDEVYGEIEVHGGLTYSDSQPEGWVIGFDCAHAGDAIHGAPPSEGVYRDKGYVKNELKFLVTQLERM